MSTNQHPPERDHDLETSRQEETHPQPEHQQEQKTGDLAQLALYSGIILAVLNALQQAQGLPGFPDFWYRNRMSWWGLSFFLIAISAYTLRPGQSNDTTATQDSLRESKRPPQPDTESAESAKPVIRVFSRSNCSLCDKAIETLRDQFGPSANITLVNIDAPEFDPARYDQYSSMIPVVEINGVVRFRGRVDPRLLARLINAEAVNLP